MSEKEEKPFSAHQYEWINGHLVRKEEYQQSIASILGRVDEIDRINHNTTKNLNILLTVLKWLGGIVGALVIAQMFDFFINLGK